MAVTDLWTRADGTPSARHGRGKRWRVTVAGHPSRAFAGKQSARAWELELLRRPPVPAEARITVGELVEAWLAGKRGLSPKGVTSAAGDARHVRAAWGDRQASLIEQHEVQAWVAGMVAVVGGRERPASVAMRQRALQCLRGALQIGVDTGALQRNVADRVRVPRGDRRDPRFLAMDDLICLAWSCDAWQGQRWLPGYWAPLVMLLGTAGLRVGESAALTVGDVDARRGRLRVRRAKSGRGRDVAIPSRVLAMLDLGRPGSAPLFVGPDGGRLDPDVWRARAFGRAVELCELDGLRIHDLRHTAASLAISTGATVVDVQAMLGHSRASTTLDIYAHLLHDGVDDVARRVDALIG